MTKKKPATLAERARKIAGTSRFYVDRAREVIGDVEDIKTGLEQFTEGDVNDAIETLRSSLEGLNEPAALDLGISEENLAKLLQLVDDLEQGMPDTEVLSTLTEMIEAADEAVTEVENQRDDPSSYDADERNDTRETARSALEELADALDNAAGTNT